MLTLLAAGPAPVRASDPAAATPASIAENRLAMADLTRGFDTSVASLEAMNLESGLSIVPMRGIELAVTTGAAQAILSRVPSPATLGAPVKAEEELPEPTTMLFGLAIVAAGFSKLASAFVRCWRATAKVA